MDLKEKLQLLIEEYEELHKHLSREGWDCSEIKGAAGATNAIIIDLKKLVKE